MMKNQPAAVISVPYDLRYYKATIAELEEYLLSALRDWPLFIAPPADSPPYPRLSPGALLLCRRRLHPSRLDPSQKAHLCALEQQKDALCEHWQSAWRTKVTLDIEMNLILWQNYLQESQDQGAYYPVEVRQRVILELLHEEVQTDPIPSLDALTRVDGRLKRAFISGEFVWQDDLRPAFPQERFWYLYGRIGIVR